MNTKLSILLVAATLASSGQLQAQNRRVGLIGTPTEECRQEVARRSVDPKVRDDWVQGCVNITNQYLLPCFKRAEASGLKGDALGAQKMQCEVDWAAQLRNLATREKSLPYDPTKPRIPVRPPGG
jgi:hypothetical protein